jgi:hypothetical protein
VAKGLARVANALAIGIGAGMEGYGKGTLASLMQQREAALAEIRERRADARAQQQMEFSAGESEKTREFSREQSQESMAWEKEKFGMQQAAEEQKFGRSLAAQKQLAAMRGSGGSEKALPADIQKVEYLAKLLAEEEGAESVTAAHRKTAFERLNQERATGGSSAQSTATMKQAEELARLRKEVAAGNTDLQPQLRALEETMGVGEFARQSASGTKGVTPLQYWTALQRQLELKVPPGMEPTPAQVDQAKRELAAGGIFDPSAPEQGVPAPQSAAPKDAATQSHIAGAGTEDDPYVATSEEELERLYNSLDAGSFVRYGNRLLEK